MIPPRILSAFRRDLTEFLSSMKPHIGNEYRAHEDDTIPGMLITIGADFSQDGISWGYQTGDNSYNGAAYNFRDWAVVSLYRRSNCKLLARDACEQLTALWAQR